MPAIFFRPQCVTRWSSSYDGATANKAPLAKMVAYPVGNMKGHPWPKWSASRVPCVLSIVMVSYGNAVGTGMILGLRPANERRRYKVTPSLIGWAQT